MKQSIFLFIGVLLLTNYSRGQGSSFGITAGALFSSYKVKAESVSITSKTKTGFTVGITSSIPLGQYCRFMPGLNFLQKGGTFKMDDGSDKTTLNYIEVPLNFVYSAASSKGNFFVGAGPSLSMGLSGKDKWEDATGSGSDDIKFGSGVDDDLKAFEAGVNFLAGYQCKGGFLVTANYNAGLSNLAINDPDAQVQSKYYNRYFGISIGYMFPGKKK